MRARLAASLVLATLSLAGCARESRMSFPSTSGALALDRVVLYRNGIGYFERRGKLGGSTLAIKVRKDQIDDMLKSLTIVDRTTGRALSVSMPLDPQTWATAALTNLQPGSGNLAGVLDSLRGVSMRVSTTQGELAGRVVMVEETNEEPDPGPERAGAHAVPAPLGRDHKLTLMQDQVLKVVRLSKVKTVTLEDGDLALQLHRRLDATAGEGMFQQVDVSIRLSEDVSTHDLVVSYVVEAPMWKPSYRVVLPEKGKGEALLQAWAVVDNVSGEDWNDVTMSLTAGEPLAFRYDLHTPRRVAREDVSGRIHSRRAAVAVGETSFDAAEGEAPPAPPAEMASSGAAREEGGYDYDGDLDKVRLGPGSGDGGHLAKGDVAGEAFRREGGFKRKPPRLPRAAPRTAAVSKGKYDDSPAGSAAPEPTFTLENLRQSTAARTKAASASGLTRFELTNRVTVPDGTSTMLALINDAVKGEETFLFKPGGAGQGYESNPYRVVRFQNSTPFVLESGPISIFSGGSFVGEGISEAVGAGASVTIPFAVEPGILVTRESGSVPEEMKLVKIVRGVLHVERFSRLKTTWKVTAQTLKDGFTVLIRHPRMGTGYQLKDRPEGTEELPDAFLVPLKVAQGALTGSIELVEQQPTRTTIHILDSSVPLLFERMLALGSLSAEERAKLQPVVDQRREIGRIDTEIAGYRSQQRELDQRGNKTRENLFALEKDKSPEAAAMRRDLQQRLDEWTKEGDRLGREIVRLDGRRTQLVVKLDDLLQGLSIADR
ncbi:MAG: DUF4139 domain-containing protein [Deltaproteobacteria bacterium]|nr:DUF4139 domain-containing protein [Deltaproteobacteria bacterium]